MKPKAASKQLPSPPGASANPTERASLDCRAERERRMTSARSLLPETEQAVKQIAAAVGYRDACRFGHHSGPLKKPGKPGCS